MSLVPLQQSQTTLGMITGVWRNAVISFQVLRIGIIQKFKKGDVPVEELVHSTRFILLYRSQFLLD
jgi:hypothetical protein